MPPDTPIPFSNTAGDAGELVKILFTHRDTLLGKRDLVAADYYTPAQVISAFDRVFSKAGGKAKFVHISKDDYRGALAAAGIPSNAQEELYYDMSFMHGTTERLA